MSDLSRSRKIGALVVIYLGHFGDWLEELLMRYLNAKWVPGGDPSKMWERALRRHSREVAGQTYTKIDEGWEDVGSLLY